MFFRVPSILFFIYFIDQVKVFFFFHLQKFLLFLLLNVFYVDFAQSIYIPEMRDCI